jgi:phage shock protein E
MLNPFSTMNITAHRYTGLIVTLFAAIALVAAEAQQTPMVLGSGPGPLKWLTDLPQAQSLAKAGGKSVLLFFHGSDWCPTCAEMQRQVFDSPEFAQYARGALVLVDVDFPEKHAQAEAVTRANLALKARFNLSQAKGEGFPTIVLLDDAGQTVFQETGYAGGGPAEVLPKLQRHTGTGANTNAAAAFNNLSVDEFAGMAADKQNVILDVRTAQEFAAGHVPGAVNLDVTAADFESKAASLDPSKPYLVYCASGVRSVRACDQLARLKFLRLFNLPGGFRAWARAGKTVEQ